MLKPLSVCRCRCLLSGRPYGSEPLEPTSLLCLECPRRRLEGVETDDPACEKDEGVYCGWDVGAGAAC